LNKIINAKIPSIVPIVSTGELLNYIYVITEYPEGIVLSAVLQNRPDHYVIYSNEMFDLIHSILDALKAIHSEGIQHLFLNPSSIFYTSDKKIVLTDCCFIDVINVEDFSDEILKDYSCYISPEVLQFINQPIGFYSDLFSIGVVIYKIVTNLLPFDTSSLHNFIYSMLYTKPSSMKLFNPFISSTFESIIFKLLDVNPLNRYGSIEELITDIKNIYRKDKKSKSLFTSLRKYSDYLKFIGRNTELMQLNEMYTAFQEGKGRMVIISGESGVGKSRLIEEFKINFIKDSSMLIIVLCSIRDQNEPFSTIQKIINQIIGYIVQEKEEFSSVMVSVIKEFAIFRDQLLKIFPIADLIFKHNTHSQKNGATSKWINKSSEINSLIVHLLSLIANELNKLHYQLIIVIEDVQWSDFSSLEIIKNINKHIDAINIIMIITMRSEFENNDIVKEIVHNKTSLKIGLGPLNYPETCELAFSIVQIDFDTYANVYNHIYSKSKGKPLEIIAISKFLLNNNINSYSSDNDDVMNGIIDFEEIIFQNIKKLNVNEKNLLDIIAIIGKEISIKTLASIMNIDESELLILLKSSSILDLIKIDIHSYEVNFINDKLRDTYIALIDPERKKMIHKNIAEYFASNINAYDTAIYDVIYHYISINEIEKALQYIFDAVKKAKEIYAYQDIIKILKIIIDAISHEGVQRKNETYFDLILELSYLLIMTGQLDEANNYIKRLNVKTLDDERKLNFYSLCCDLYYKRGEWSSSEKYARKGLKILHEQLPDNKQVIVYIIKEVLKSLFSQLYKFIPLSSTNKERKIKIFNFLEPLGMSYVLSNTLKFLYIGLRSRNIAHRIGYSKQMCISLYARAGIAMIIALYPLATLYLKKSRKVSKKIDDQWLEAKTYELEGYCNEWQGNYSNGINNFNKAIEMFTKLGDVKELLMSLNGLEHCYYYMGNYFKAEAINQEYLNIAEKINDSYSITAAYIYFAQIEREKGNFEKSAKYAYDAFNISDRENILFNKCSALNELGATAIMKKNYTEAVDFLVDAQQIITGNSFIPQYVYPVYYNFADAVIKLYQRSNETLDVIQDKQLYHKMKKAAYKSIMKTFYLPTHFASSLRVAAAYFFGVKHKKLLSDVLFWLSYKVAEKYHRKYEVAKTCYEYSQMLIDVGSDRVDNFIQKAFNCSIEIGAHELHKKLNMILGYDTENRYKVFIEKSIYGELIAFEKDKLLNKRIIEYNSHNDYIKATVAILNDLCKIVLAEGSIIVECSNDEFSLHYCCNINDNEYNAKNFCIKEYADYSLINNLPYIVTHNIHGIDFQLLYIPVQQQDLMIIFYSRYNFFTETIAREIFDFLLSIKKIVTENVETQKQKINKSTREVISNKLVNKIQIAKEYIEKNYQYNISKHDIATVVDLNADYFARLFKQLTGENLGDYINRIRIAKASELLIATDKKIIEIAFDVGFEDLSTFNRNFFKFLKKSPKTFRKQ
jgi:AraC-like DNA-binding protein/serine/threonine protein kinase